MGAGAMPAPMVSFRDPRDRHPFHMHDMIRAQPGFVEETLRRVEGIDPEALFRGPRRILVTGCGTSFHAAQIGARLLATAFGSRAAVQSVHAYDLVFGSPGGRGVLVVGVSHSGNTPTTNAALARARRQGARTVGISGLPGAPIERVAHRTVVLGSVHDRSWANTMSYTSQLVAFASFARRIADGGTASSRALRKIPSTLQAALGCEPAIRALARSVVARSRVTFLGTGLDDVTAQEAALKIRETCSMPATGYHTEQILHGPFLALDRGDAVVGLRSQDDDWRADEILEALAHAGPRVARIGDGRPVDVPLPRAPADLRPLVSIVPLQFLAYHAALARGANPDVMRTDVGRYARGIDALFTWRPHPRRSGRPSRPRSRSAG